MGPLGAHYIWANEALNGSFSQEIEQNGSLDAFLHLYKRHPSIHPSVRPLLGHTGVEILKKCVFGQNKDDLGYKISEYNYLGY